MALLVASGPAGFGKTLNNGTFKVKFEVGGEEVVASGATVEDEDDAMAEAVIDEVLDGDEGLGSVAGAKGEETAAGLSLDELGDDEDFFEVSSVIPNRRLSRKVASDYSRWRHSALLALISSCALRQKAKASSRK